MAHKSIIVCARRAACAVLIAACAAAPCSAQDTWKAEVVRAAWQCIHRGEAFDPTYVCAAQTDHLPSLDVYTSRSRDAWIRAVRADARLARAILRNHHALVLGDL